VAVLPNYNPNKLVTLWSDCG